MAGDDIAWSWLSELTTRFGPRPAGSANERAAAEWSAAKLKALGFENVQIQTFPITAWIRGPEKVELVAPIAQPLAAVSLGESPPTPPAGIEADVVAFDTLEDLMAAPDGSLAGQDRPGEPADDAGPGRRRLRPDQPHPHAGADHRRAQGRGRLPDALGRHRHPSPGPHRHHGLRERQGADPRLRPLRPRRRADGAAEGAGPADPRAPVQRRALRPERPQPERHRRDQGPRASRAGGPARRPPRQLGPGHGRDRRRGRRRHHHGRGQADPGPA